MPNPPCRRSNRKKFGLLLTRGMNQQLGCKLVFRFGSKRSVCNALHVPRSLFASGASLASIEPPITFPCPTSISASPIQCLSPFSWPSTFRNPFSRAPAPRSVDDARLDWTQAPNPSARPLQPTPLGRCGLRRKCTNDHSTPRFELVTRRLRGEPNGAQWALGRNMHTVIHLPTMRGTACSEA